MLLSLQEIVRGGITVSGIFDYRLTPELSIAVCYADSPITVSYCVGIYDEWPDNRIVLDTWYQIRRIKWCSAWGVPYVSLHRYTFLYDQVQVLLCACLEKTCTVFHEACFNYSVYNTMVVPCIKEVDMVFASFLYTRIFGSCFQFQTFNDFTA